MDRAAAAAAKSLQSCPTLCDPMDCSLLGSSVHGTELHVVKYQLGQSYTRSNIPHLEGRTAGTQSDTVGITSGLGNNWEHTSPPSSHEESPPCLSWATLHALRLPRAPLQAKHTCPEAPSCMTRISDEQLIRIRI